MPFLSLNAEFVDSKTIDRLCSAEKEKNEEVSSDLTVITSSSDLKQVYIYNILRF